jgi:uronate dehydrogenase
VLTENVGCSVVWGASNNQRMTWWKDDARVKLNWQPIDSADPFAGQLAGKVSGNPVAERYMGGGFCALGYSREVPAPRQLFE